MKKNWLLIILCSMILYKEAAYPVTAMKKTPKQPTFIFEQDPTLLTTTVRVIFRTGSAADPEGKHGVANLLGEMLLRGTKKRKREDFQSEIERMGAQIGVRVSQDSIVVAGEVIRENSDKFLKLLQEAVLQPSFDKKEFDALKKESLAEISHAKNSNGRLAGMALRKALFAGTPMEYSTQGTLGTVRAITHKDLLAAFPKLIHNGDMLIGVASAMKESELRPSFDALVAKLPDGVANPYVSIPVKKAKPYELIVVHKPKTSTGSILMGQAGITAQDPDRYALGVGNFSFGGEPLISRLFKTIRSELGWTYAIGTTYSTLGTLTNQQGVFAISTTPTTEFTTKTLLKVLSMWKEYLDKGITKDELSLAHMSLVNSYPFEFDSADKRLSKKLYEKMYGVPVLSPEQYKKTIESIGNTEVKNALKAKQTVDGWVISMVADAGVLEKQLAEGQKDLPESRRLRITKKVDPDSLIQ